MEEDGKMAADILAESRKELMEKGYIDQDMLSWIHYGTSVLNLQYIFLGVRGGELMVLPIVNFKEMLFNEVRYYKKEDITEFSLSAATGKIKIRFGKEGSLVYRSVASSIPDTKKIIAYFGF